MSFSNSFIAVQGKSKAEVAEALAAVDTGQAERELYGRDAFSIADLPSGWVVVCSGDYDWVTPERLAAVSEGSEALGWRLDERVMASDAFGYRDGRELWSILYDCEEGPEVAASGDLPKVFAGIYAKIQAKQAEGDAKRDEVDYIFDVPVETVRALCGFRHDEDDALASNFTVLRGRDAPRETKQAPAREPGKPGFFASLFGRR